MSDFWQQLLAALSAAVVPVLVKFFNDWLDTKKTNLKSHLPHHGPSEEPAV